MLQQAGKPYTGDVALNQDNLTSVGLIELYRTLLNKAETMSLRLGVKDAGANQQLLLAVERLHDLYRVLGDEAYADAANPTIGFGSQFIADRVTLDYGAASGALFCFDNQVPTLLDEELALIRGRSCVNAPGNTVAPFYNRLVWNFTKGITAGEVAYAVNYNVGGTETVALSEEQAARIYPQGHGDAYGHYLSALQGWYRLLRNPNFDWGQPSMSALNVADTVVNADYYEEAKFAEAAAAAARTAKRAVELTALKHWRDRGANTVGGGYIDANPTNAFGYGEWAARGAFGALCNWAVANSLLPDAEAARPESAPYQDKGLLRIDRSTVAGIGEIAAAAESIQRTEDRMDAGMNPLGFNENAVPFDLTPIGSAADATHPAILNRVLSQHCTRIFCALPDGTFGLRADWINLIVNLNDYNMKPFFFKQAKDLEANGCRVDVVGSQMHLFNPAESVNIARGEGPAHLRPENVAERFRVLSQANRPIHLSEITITAPDNSPRGQMVQAIIMRNLYRAWFSVEKMNGITWWNVVDDCGAPGEPSISGLFTRDMRPKTAYFAMDDLVNREWRTKCEVKVKGEGERRTVSFRGFRGRYRLSWTDASGKAVSKLVEVR